MLYLLAVRAFAAAVRESPLLQSRFRTVIALSRRDHTDSLKLIRFISRRPRNERLVQRYRFRRARVRNSRAAMEGDSLYAVIRFHICELSRNYTESNNTSLPRPSYRRGAYGVPSVKICENKRDGVHLNDLEIAQLTRRSSASSLTPAIYYRPVAKTWSA